MILGTRHQALIRENAAKLEGLASLNEEFAIRYRYMFNRSQHTGELKLTWAEIFKIVGPHFYSPSGPATISSNIIRYIHDLNRDRIHISVNSVDADTVKIHLAALGLLKIEAANAKGGGVGEFVTLTEKGKSELLNVMAVRTESIAVED